MYHLFGLLARQLAQLGQQLCAGLDGLQRRAQIVRNRRHKLGLDLIQFLEAADVLHNGHFTHSGEGCQAGVEGSPIGHRDLGRVERLIGEIVPQPEQRLVVQYLRERTWRGQWSTVEKGLARGGTEKEDPIGWVGDNDGIPCPIEDGFQGGSFAVHAAKEARVFDGPRHLGGQRLEESLIVLRKGADFGASHVEHADRTCLDLQTVRRSHRDLERDGKFAACLAELYQGPVSLILQDVGYEDRTLQADHVSGDAFA